jgi:hypothetical protein
MLELALVSHLKLAARRVVERQQTSSGAHHLSWSTVMGLLNIGREL